MNDLPKFRTDIGPPLRTPQQRVLAQWRRVDYAPLEYAQARAAQPLEKVLSRVLTSLHLDHRHTDVEVLKAWNHLLDPNIVAHAHPIRLHKGTLFVNVDSSVWLSEIVRYRREEILERLQHCFGRDLVVRISFRAG